MLPQEPVALHGESGVPRLRSGRRVSLPEEAEHPGSRLLAERRSTALDSEADPLLPPLTDSDSDGSEAGKDDQEVVRAQVPLLGNQKVIIDDKNASYVLVFPRQRKGHGGTVCHTDLHHNPKEDWDSIFGAHHSSHPCHSAPAFLTDAPIPEGEYQERVRARVLEILSGSGFKARSVESVDEDEVLLKISVPKEILHRLATTFQYKAPVTAKAYEHEGGYGTSPGGHPLVNGNGVPVPAYMEFSEEVKDKLAEFTHIDEIRLIIKYLSTRMSLSNMVKQNIITEHFPGADHASVMDLHREWAGFHNLHSPPDESRDEMIRLYFGEEIAFFFQYFALYVRGLGLLAIVGVISWVRYAPSFNQTQHDRMLVYFGLITVVWETIFHRMSIANRRRSVQLWGMSSYGAIEDDLPTYDPSQENTQQLRILRGMTSVVVIGYVALFAVIISCMNIFFAGLKRSGDSWLYRLLPWVQTFLVKFLSFLWRKIAYYLVLWQNHRTCARFNNALIKNLAIVKLFVGLYPFFYTAFVFGTLTRNMTCGPTLAEAAQEVYKIQPWPWGLPDYGGGVRNFTEGGPPREEELHFLQGYWFSSIANGTTQVCISGCYPVACISEPTQTDPHAFGCRSNCVEQLQNSLLNYYVVHIAFTAICLVVPIFWTKGAVFKEMKKAKKMHDGHTVQYSFLQLQAKTRYTAAYEFASWGGSYVEDFLELIVPYALLACFGILAPSMCIVGFVCLLVEYRLLAYRMTNVTCRPQPRGSQGLGLFDDVLEVVSVLALSFNVGIVMFMLLPYRNWALKHKLLGFCAAEKALLLLRSVLTYLVPDVPEDVRRIEDFNDQFKRHQMESKRDNDSLAPEKELFDDDEIDIGLFHKTGAVFLHTGSDGEMSSSSGDLGLAC